jgi:hypothetical protein
MGVGDPELDAFGYQAPRSRAPLVRFSAIGEAWGLFLAQLATWLLTGLIAALGNWVVLEAVSSVVGKPHGHRGFGVPVPQDDSWLHILVIAVVDGFFLGGMFRMACLQVRGRPIHVRDLFSVTDVLPQLAFGSALYALICAAAGLLCFFPAFLAAGVLMFTIPLVVDARLDADQAIRQSWQSLKWDWLMAAAFQFVLAVILGLGGCCCLAGVPVTMPLYCLSISVLYRDALLTKPSHPSAKPSGPFSDL